MLTTLTATLLEHDYVHIHNESGLTSEIFWVIIVATIHSECQGYGNPWGYKAQVCTGMSMGHTTYTLTKPIPSKQV
jgi:hypothetical protein